MSNASNCILARVCKLAGTAQCTRLCSSYIAMHGYSGDGGRVGAANVPADYRKVALTNSPARGDQPEAYQIADAYAATFARQFDPDAERIKSLYLFSREPGTGKTTTAIALLNEWLTIHYIGSLQRDKQPLQRPAYFFDVNEWQELYNQFNRPRVPNDIAELASREYYRRMEHARLTPFVVMDDIGVRECSEGFRGDLHAIINHRVTNGLVTVYTSNVTIEDLQSVFDRRLADRIRDMCGVVQFKGESKRGLRR
ncbi:DNA replication protein [Paenibacillus sp. ACRRX]|uniref:DNA replication protein n=1 Tax=Paenibacillus sp. ACRRX TaxID=2918206 RepID=UPI001EF5C626|nr:DNA replication protein [Paenibacillus sp. ACRRX]MCG7407743.1 DNA replication protein [Paenibacillus sp. ACRRX]